MRGPALSVAILLLLCSCVLGQSYEMTIHLSGGGTATIPLDDIQRIEFANLTGVEDAEEPGQTPLVFRVLQNYPNPFNPSTTIAYETPSEADITVRIYDVHGSLVRELLTETEPAGRHQIPWDGTNGRGERVASGVYFYAVDFGEKTLSQKLILIR